MWAEERDQRKLGRWLTRRRRRRERADWFGRGEVLIMREEAKTSSGVSSVSVRSCYYQRSAVAWLPEGWFLSHLYKDRLEPLTINNDGQPVCTSSHYTPLSRHDIKRQHRGALGCHTGIGTCKYRLPGLEFEARLVLMRRVILHNITIFSGTSCVLN